jgi:hypothetical protein
MSYQIILGYIGCIAPHQPYKQIWTYLLPNVHLLWQLREGQPHLKSKIKNKKPNVKLNILDEGFHFKNEVFPLNDEGIA